MADSSVDTKVPISDITSISVQPVHIVLDSFDIVFRQLHFVVCSFLEATVESSCEEFGICGEQRFVDSHDFLLFANDECYYR